MDDKKKWDLILSKFHMFTKEQWENELLEFPYSEIPELVEMVWDEAKKESSGKIIEHSNHPPRCCGKNMEARGGTVGETNGKDIIIWKCNKCGKRLDK